MCICQNKKNVLLLQMRLPEGAAEGSASAATSPNPSLSKMNPSPSKKIKKKVEDRTLVGLFFSQGKSHAAKQKECSARIRRCRGIFLTRLKVKKTPGARKEYARRHEGILLHQEDAIAAKHQQRLEKRKFKENEWQTHLLQMDLLLLKPKKLAKKDEKEIKDLLSHHFPDNTPPPSKDETVSSLDSELTSDTSDDEIYPDQAVGAKSIRVMSRLAKKERKMERRKQRRKQKVKAKKTQMAYAAREPIQKISEQSMQISKLRYIPAQQVKENVELDFHTGEFKTIPRPKKKLKPPPGTVKY